MSSCQAMPFTVFVTVRVAANVGNATAQITAAISAALPIVPFIAFCLFFIFVSPFELSCLDLEIFHISSF